MFPRNDVQNNVIWKYFEVTLPQLCQLIAQDSWCNTVQHTRSLLLSQLYQLRALKSNSDDDINQCRLVEQVNKMGQAFYPWLGTTFELLWQGREKEGEGRNLLSQIFLQHPLLLSFMLGKLIAMPSIAHQLSSGACAKKHRQASFQFFSVKIVLTN